MPSWWVIKSVGMLVLSFVIGILFYYYTSPLSVKKKKKQLEDVVSLLINLIIYIWVGKILLHMSLFFSDPLAVLAYPSNADSLYIAVLLLLINVGYRVWKHQFHVINWLGAFLPVLIAAAFSYELMQIIGSPQHQISQLILLMLLLLIYLLVENRLPMSKVIFYIGTLWLAGEAFLPLVSSQLTLFGYVMKPLYNLVLAILTIGYIFYSQRKQV